MNKTLKKVLIIVIPIILIFIILAVVSCILIINSVNKAGNIDYYTLGDDKIISITNIVGERNANNISTKKSNGIITKEYRYVNVSNTKSDISKYTEELKNNNFVNTTDIDLSKDNDTISLASLSVDSDNIIIITISYDLDSYTITLKKGKGSIQPYN